MSLSGFLTEAQLDERAPRLVTDDVRLTKDWLMGVRRGWVALMKPQISGYDDVYRAIEALQVFVGNLKDQVTFVRRGPRVGSSLTNEHMKVHGWLDELEANIYEALSRAKYWGSYLDGTAHSLKWGEDRSDDARKMLDLYRSDFADATAGSVPARGKRGLHRPRSLTELMDKLLAELRKDAARREKYYQDPRHEKLVFDEPVYREFNIGGVKLVVERDTLEPHDVRRHAEVAGRVKAALERNGFKKLWRGLLIIRCSTCGGTNQYGAELGVAGRYFVSPDRVELYGAMHSGPLERSLYHELGHRWWFKHMTQEQRARFERWIKGGVSPVSEYGTKHIVEAFAEAFMLYILRRGMSPNQLETFKRAAFGRLFRESSDLVAVLDHELKVGSAVV